MSSAADLHHPGKLAPSTKRDISRLTFCNSLRDKIPRKRSNQCKRAKKTYNSKKSVTFVTPEDVVGYSPCDAGPHDAAGNDIGHQHIWYTSKEYASFLQDRIDNIRVYRSVHGNMSGLEDYYCTTGLEHFLPDNGQILLKQSQMRVVSAVLTEQRRQKLFQRPDPEHLSRLVDRLSTVAKDQAQKRASAYALPSSKSLNASDFGNDKRSGMSHIGKEILSNPIRLSSLPLPSTKRTSSSMFSLDETTLQQMNLKLLESFHNKSESTSTNVASEKDSIASKLTFESLSTPENANSAVLAAMNEALAITDIFSDPECK